MSIDTISGRLAKMFYDRENHAGAWVTQADEETKQKLITEVRDTINAGSGFLESSFYVKTDQGRLISGAFTDLEEAKNFARSVVENDTEKAVSIVELMERPVTRFHQEVTIKVIEGYETSNDEKTS